MSSSYPIKNTVMIVYDLYKYIKILLLIIYLIKLYLTKI